MSMSQSCPVKPGRQRHSNPGRRLTQDPPLRHGLGVHSSIAVSQVFPVNCGGQLHVQLSLTNNPPLAQVRLQTVQFQNRIYIHKHNHRVDDFIIRIPQVKLVSALAPKSTGQFAVQAPFITKKGQHTPLLLHAPWPIRRHSSLQAVVSNYSNKKRHFNINILTKTVRVRVNS